MLADGFFWDSNWHHNKIVLTGMCLIGKRKATLMKVLALALGVGMAFGQSTTSTTCSIDDVSADTAHHPHDPDLHVLQYVVGEDMRTTKVYIEPGVATFYKDPESCASRTKVKSAHSGLQGKFCNLSNQTVIFSFSSGREIDAKPHIEYLDPWESIFQTSFTGQEVTVTTTTNYYDGDSKTILAQVKVQDYPHTTYTYDPYNIKHYPNPPSSWTAHDQQQYTKWRKILLFHQQYLVTTGRSYLPNSVRQPPRHFQWPAEYLGQEHWITTKQTHFTELPPPEIMSENKAAADRERRMPPDPEPVLCEYRNTSTTFLNLTLRVLSVAPRVLEIPNFLSPKEVEHMLWMELAKRFSMRGQGAMVNLEIFRDDSPILDAIYRRAADVQRVNEALLRTRDVEELSDVTGVSSLAESLEIVHYSEGQQDSVAHTDFTSEKTTHAPQESRFSTLVLYLNQPEEGGETSFPRWSNAETAEGLDITPELGKAVLFYSMLPDGNYDDLSQHISKPVVKGAKYVTNLWLWDTLDAA